MYALFKSFSTIVAIGYVIAMLVGIYGWVNNIVKIVGLISTDISTIAVELIIRLIGVPVAPLGVVAGFF